MVMPPASQTNLNDIFDTMMALPPVKGSRLPLAESLSASPPNSAISFTLSYPSPCWMQRVSTMALVLAALILNGMLLALFVGKIPQALTIAPSETETIADEMDHWYPHL